MTERATARQVVRDDAQAFGWTLEDIGIHDVFKRDNHIIVMGWLNKDPQRLALGAWLETDHKLAEQDTTVLCIVTCREWLTRFGADRVAPART